MHDEYKNAKKSIFFIFYGDMLFVQTYQHTLRISWRHSIYTRYLVAIALHQALTEYIHATYKKCDNYFRLIKYTVFIFYSAHNNGFDIKSVFHNR